ncbi:MAG: hypothetical protein FWC62_09310 [Firmicutes bacterium]|nr:hypothetical protein [Bacillota bacterium]
MDNFLTYLGLCRRAGFLETGEENTGLCARAGKARLILLTSDASENTRKKAESFAKSGAGIPLVTLPRDKTAFSAAVGRACAIAAVSDIGFAAGIVRQMNVLEPGKHEELAQMLKQKRDKAMRRRRETAARDLAKKIERMKRREPK